MWLCHHYEQYFVAIDEARAYLEALAERFPAWGFEAAVPPTAEPREQTQYAADSPEDLVAKLAAVAPRLSAKRRAEIARQLQGWGFAVQTEAGPAAVATEMACEVPVELQKKLSIQPDAALDQARVLRLIGLLVDFVVTLDQVVWSLWKNLATQSIVRRDAASDLRKLAGPYLTGDSEVSTAQITQALDKTRQLGAGLLAAIGTTGENFARNFLAQFSPASIKARADAESGFFIGPEQKCWRKYIDLLTSSAVCKSSRRLTKSSSIMPRA